MRLQSVSDALGPLSPLANLSLSSPHRVLIVGCAYGGISALVNLIDLAQGKARDTVYPVPNTTGRKTKNGVEITVIDERDGYFHSVGAPLAHVTPKHTSKMWKRYSHLNELQHKNLKFKHGSVQKIDPSTKVAEWLDRSGKKQEQPYDYVIVATGLKRHWPAVPKSGSYEEFLSDSNELVNTITGGDPDTKTRKVVVIGAGAVGVEFAAEIKNYYPGIHVTLVHSRSEVLSSEPLPAEVKEKAKTLLIEEGVELALENRASVKDLPDGTYEVTLANGTVLNADVVLDATKKGSATTGFLPAEILNEEKEILVNPQLNFMDKVPNAESHFGVGDVIAWSGIKRAGGAMVMGELAASNVYASILNAEAAATPADATASSPNSSAPLTLGELPFYNNVIGLAVGKQCLTYDQKNGMKWGVQLMKDYFQDDLGWKANLKYLRLSDVVEVPKDELKKDVQIGEVGVEAVSAKA